jgi:hypothetical protein
MKIMTSTCSCCGQTKTKNQIRDGKKFKYVDENNTPWLGKFCPDCKKHYYAKRRKENPEIYKVPRKPLLDKQCIVCDKHFQTNNPNMKICSKECRKAYKNISRRKIKNCKTCGKEMKIAGKHYCSKECKPKQKYTPKEKKTYTKACLTCNKEFTTTSKRKSYCTKKHSQSNINYAKKYRSSDKAKMFRKQRKKIEKFKQPISKKYKKEILAIYDNKPEGYDVDHIIPINHPDVCGLHVPWNLTYLDKSSNQLKSNQFDFTMENIGWKNIRKAG